MTADPLGRALRADLSRSLAMFSDAETGLTGLGISDAGFWETPESEVETLVDVSDVLLEVFSDLGELLIVSAILDMQLRDKLTFPPFVPAIKILLVSYTLNKTIPELTR